MVVAPIRWEDNMSGLAMWNIFVSKLSFAPEAVVGVGLIGIYFVYIVGTALLRIKNADHMDH